MAETMGSEGRFKGGTMRVRPMLSILAICALGSSSEAQEFTMKDYVFEPGRGYSYVFATPEYMTVLHLPSLKSQGDVRQGWFTRVFSRPQSLGGFNFDRSAEKTEIDCQHERMRVISMALYTGSHQVHVEEATTAWRPIVPDTRASINMKAACDPTSLKGEADLDSLAAKYLKEVSTLAH